MNLAQCIDPHWVRDGALQRVEPRRSQEAGAPIPEAPPQRATNDLGARSEKRIELLRAVELLARREDAPPQLGAIVRHMKTRPSATSMNVGNAIKEGYLLRAGTRHSYRYSLSPRGVKYLSVHHG